MFFLLIYLQVRSNYLYSRSVCSGGPERSLTCYALNFPRGKLPGDVELTHAPGTLSGATLDNPFKFNKMNTTQFTQAAKATQDAMHADNGTGRVATMARVILFSQLGRMHKHCKQNKLKIGDTIEPIAKGAGVNPDTYAKLCSIGRAVYDKFGAIEPVAQDALSAVDFEPVKGLKRALASLDKSGHGSNARKWAQTLAGVKVDKSDKEREEANEGNTIRTEVEAKAPGSKGAATMDVSDDPQVAALEWLKLGQQAAKACNVDFTKFLQTAGLHQYEVKA